MKAVKFNLDNSDRIKLEFPFIKEFIEKVRQIEGALWSQPHIAWHIPFTRQAFLALRYRFPDMEFDSHSFEAIIDRSEILPVPSYRLPKTKVVVLALEVDRVRMFCIRPGNDEKLIGITRQLPGVSWSPKWSGWLLANNSANLRLIFGAFKGVTWVDTSLVFSREYPVKEISGEKKSPVLPKRIDLPVLSAENESRLLKFIEWLRSSRYSKSTVKTYSDSLRIFFRYLNNKVPDEIGNNDLIEFNNQYILKNGFSASFQNQVVNAVKLYFRKIENRKLDIESIQRPRREKKLPNVLSKQEVERLIKAASVNIKHQSMLALIYSCGLRRSELINLKLTDIDSNRGLLLIRDAKGKKDRVSPLSEKVVEMLRDNYRKNRTEVYLFEGWEKGMKYSERALEEVLKKYIKLAVINKPVTLHWLRHSYATHLLENGTDLRYIQEILGHKSSKTTEIYTHVSNKQLQRIKSPFDDLNLL
jgi:integrase/recombinase XerD